MYDGQLSLLICLEIKKISIILLFGIYQLFLNFIVPLLHFYDSTPISIFLVLLDLDLALFHLFFSMSFNLLKVLLEFFKLASGFVSVFFINQAMFGTVFTERSKLFQNNFKGFLELALFNSDARSTLSISSVTMVSIETLTLTTIYIRMLLVHIGTLLVLIGYTVK